MVARRASHNISSHETGLPEKITFERIVIYDHETPTLQELRHSANYFKPQHGYKFCWAKNAVIFFRKNETSRPIKQTNIENLMKLITQSQGAAHQSNE